MFITHIVDSRNYKSFRCHYIIDTNYLISSYYCGKYDEHTAHYSMAKFVFVLMKWSNNIAKVVDAIKIKDLFKLENSHYETSNPKTDFSICCGIMFINFSDLDYDNYLKLKICLTVENNKFNILATSNNGQPCIR